MIVFLDTEFTALVARPLLLSVGLVGGTEGAQPFYAEVTDRDRLDAASWYAAGAVLPQFGQVPGAACNYAELGPRLGRYFTGLARQLEDGERLDIAFGYHLDWALVALAIKDANPLDWALTRRRLHPRNVYELTGFDEGKCASEAYFKSQASAPFSRHHALCDARALRLAYQASQTVAPHAAMA